MTELDTYVERTIDAIDAHRGDDALTARTVRSLTQDALSQDSFILTCAHRIALSMENSDRPWRNPPLFVSAGTPLMLRVFYWPPGHVNEPHLHGAWTVTGVFHNEIVVETFESGAVVDAEHPVKRITARTGETGYLLPPCTHRLHNISGLTSATFHVFSEDIHYHAHGSAKVLAKTGAGGEWRAKRLALCALADALTRIHDHSAVDVLLRIFALGDLVVRLDVVKALVGHDIHLARKMYRELEAKWAQTEMVPLLSKVDQLLANACQGRAMQEPVR